MNTKRKVTKSQILFVLHFIKYIYIVEAMRPEGTDIHKIVRNGDLNLLEFCLFGESDPAKSKPRSVINLKDRRGMTPLHAATSLGKLKIVEYLVRAGCHMNSKDKDENTALHIAAAHGHIGIANILINNGTSVNAREKVIHIKSFIHSKNINFRFFFLFLISFRHN